MEQVKQSTESGRHPPATQPLERPNIANLREKNLEKQTPMYNSNRCIDLIENYTFLHKFR